MGSGEKPKSSGGRWITIILVAVLVILAIVLIWILKDPRGFDRFKKKKTPTLKPSAMNLQIYSPSHQPEMELAGYTIRKIS